MKTLHGMLLGFFLPVFFTTLLFFILVFELVDVFSNLWLYITHDVSLLDLSRIGLFYLPKCVSYSLSIALLFSVTYSMGSYHRNNELVSVFGAGINLYRFVLPIIATGFLLSVGGFFFEEKVVIGSFRTKNDLVRAVLGQTLSFSNSNVTVTSGDSLFVYQANYYNDRQQTLTGVTLIERDGEGRFLLRVDAEYASWNGESWTFHNSRIFRFKEEAVVEESRAVLDSTRFSEPPSIFRRISRKIDEMEAADARSYIESLRKAGLPFEEALAEYHRKFSFAFTPFIVVLISSAIGGLFQRNVLLMSLLSSLAIAVVFYVAQTVAMTLAKSGLVSPVTGAWSSFIAFTGIGLGLFRFART
jgi:lipopolysaccharide export system permease protein